MLRFDLDRAARARLAGVIVALNLIFIAGMVAFLYCWEHRDHYGPRGRLFIERILVQFHLGNENVVAAWYSSMLLLLVAIACAVAYAIDRRQATTRFDRALSFGWMALVAAFLVLSLDEIGSIHERIGMIVRANPGSIVPGAPGQPIGWVYMLAIPIAVVALFMLAFGWMRLRRAPLAFMLLAAGVLLYVSDPFLELIELSLPKGSAAIYVERVLEEGIAELGGTTCVLFGVLMYASKRAGAEVHSFTVPSRGTRLLAGALLVAGVPLAHALVARLPEGDVGIAEDWFPAAAFFILAVGWFANRRAWALAGLAIVASAYFGAGLYGYAGWYGALGYHRVTITMIATAVAVLLGALDA